MSTPRRKSSATQPPETSNPSNSGRVWSWIGTALHVLHGWLAAAGRVAVLGFFTRYWLLLAVLACFVALILSGLVFSTVGTMVWLPAVGVGGWAFVLLVINIFFRKTIDRDFDTGKFAEDWAGTSREVRLILTVATTLALFLGYCIIAAGLATRS